MRHITPGEKVDLQDGDYVFCSRYMDKIVPVVITSAQEAFDFYETHGLPVEIFLEETEYVVREMLPMTMSVEMFSKKDWDKAMDKLEVING